MNLRSVRLIFVFGVFALAGCGGGSTTASSASASATAGGIAALGSPAVQPTGAAGATTAVLHATMTITGG
ncbi:MAG TPA: hypothetical protein VGE81_09685, partial [Candidatus Limnocylindrales bacterium]